jgi:hypothetical protein
LLGSDLIDRVEELKKKLEGNALSNLANLKDKTEGLVGDVGVKNIRKATVLLSEESSSEDEGEL